jgi:GH15 family glucan-1,4-alpha-glucosidase
MAELPIAEHGVIGDLRTVALVGTDGAIDWCCWPRFDSPSVFAAVLDGERGGHFRIAPHGGCATRQLYFPDTNVLITRFLCPRGVVELQDLMPLPGPAGEVQAIVRRLVCVRGRMRLRLECEPRFDYGRAEHAVTVGAHGAVFDAPDLSLALSSPLPLTSTGRGVTADVELAAGESVTFTLSEPADGGAPVPLEPDDSDALLEATVQFWLDWIAGCRYTGRWREMVNRSALTLKLMTYAPTGAIVAAPTTSLPEQIGGGRNWDYRYTWVRDSALTLDALIRLGFAEEARGFAGFLLERFRDSEADGGGPLRIMYRIDGSPLGPEEELTHLSGHRGSAPVRVGNAADDQLQLDIYGAIIDVAHLAERQGARIAYEGWRSIARCADWVCDAWDAPDEGIWETRGGRRRFTHSRLMCWVALARAIAIAHERSLPADLARWTAVRDRIFTWLMEEGWSDARGAFVQHDRTDVLDASVLMMPLLGFISPTDPRWLSTLDAIGEELVSDSLVFRYDPDASPDGLDGEEGTFTICSFWYVEALAAAGRVREARLVFEKILTYANHLGLFSEEIGRSGELLGNFPQAFTHLALIRAAIVLDERLGGGAAHPLAELALA